MLYAIALIGFIVGAISFLTYTVFEVPAAKSVMWTVIALIASFAFLYVTS